MIKLRSFLLAAAVTAALPAMQAEAATAFECPVPDAGATVDASLAALLPPDNAFEDVAKLNAAIDAMTASGVSRAVVIDVLVSRYCPVMAKESWLSDAEKTDRMRAFASRVTRIVFGLESEDTIIFDVALPAAIANQVTSQASAAKITPQAWIATEVDKAITGN
ncbi:hypothetical protein OSH08_15795 [Kaistia geumhonensis]|uniref:Glutelin n=1 Tax=Kaistia geumhonensis TaxID=410839 RepID=A0ABU0MAA4_9HYPH|nr:hypothetical protein [Kaistia geumhonensis]MCX5480468.1 hypothetical protein [Kaistia geumhonensis]MDQ0517832.1 hypothetical protein [Kaistia geumhonensis]